MSINVSLSLFSLTLNGADSSIHQRCLDKCCLTEAIRKIYAKIKWKFCDIFNIPRPTTLLWYRYRLLFAKMKTKTCDLHAYPNSCYLLFSYDFDLLLVHVCMTISPKSLSLHIFSSFSVVKLSFHMHPIKQWTFLDLLLGSNCYDDLSENV